MLDGEAGEQPSEHATGDLERVRDEEFDKLSRAGNNSPRGIWSDGDVMYVADANDGKVYTYNMPDAIDARLASLTLSDIDVGEFDSGRPEYEAVLMDGLTETTVEAVAVQSGAEVAIDPPDADEDAGGDQVAVEGVAEITVTVTSPDGSREKVYRLALSEAGPSESCLRGAVSEGFSLVVFEGGSIEDLVACAEGRYVTALYALEGGEYVSYIRGAPEFVNEDFRALFAEGVPSLTPLTVKSDGPATSAPSCRGCHGALGGVSAGRGRRGLQPRALRGRQRRRARCMRGRSGRRGPVHPQRRYLGLVHPGPARVREWPLP